MHTRYAVMTVRTLDVIKRPARASSQLDDMDIGEETHGRNSVGVYADMERVANNGDRR
jgi:hypothetical protein